MSDEYEEMRERLEPVEDQLASDETEHLAALRQRREAGESVMYGHDVLAAIARGYRNKSRAAAHEMLRYEHLGNSRGQDWELKPRFTFAMALGRLVEAAAAHGITIEEVRSTLREELKGEAIEQELKAGAERGLPDNSQS
jgi:hypothetical protein